MSAQDDLSRLIEVATNLNPRAVASEVKYLRAGPKRSQLGQIGHSAERALPLPDRLDKKVDRQHKRYKRNLTTALKALEENRTIQSELLTRLHLEDGLPSEEAKKLAEEEAEGRSCANCGIVVPKLLKGRCRRCYLYLKKHEVERPQNLIDRELFGMGR